MRAVALALTLGVAGCSPGGCGPSPPGGPSPLRAVVLGTTTEPATLDPAFLDVAGALEPARLVFRDLTALDERWALVPDLAASLPTATTSSAGDTVVRWRLRPGLRWSDGAPLTAADLAFGLRIEADPELGAVSHAVARRVRRLRVVAPDEAEVTWRGAYADHRAPRVHAVLPAHAYPAPVAGQPFLGAGRSPAGSGPFVPVEWAPGERLVLDRNPRWAGPPPGLDRVVFRFFPSEDALAAALATGGVDAVGEASGLGIERALSLRDRLAATHEVHFVAGGQWLHLDLRLDHPVTGRLAVREAIHLAVDRQALVEAVYLGRARPAAGLFPARHPGHSPGRVPPRRDVAAARARLGGPHPPLELEYASGSAASERAAVLVQAALAEAGLEVALRPLPLRALFDRMRRRVHAPLALYAWRVRPDWDGRSALHSTGRQNASGLADPEVDRLLDALERELDPDRRARLLCAVEDRYLALLPSIPLVFRDDVSVRPRWLEGWRPTGTASPVTWNAEAWRRADR